MKLNRNFLQISATALLTSVGFIFYMNFFQKETKEFMAPPSERILWPDAQALMSEYQGRTPSIMMTTYGQGTINPLRGFSFTRAHLMEILTSNHSGIEPDYVTFFFGTEGTFNDMTAGIQWPNMRIIAVGTKENKILSTATAGRLPSVFDKADPCPPNCPN